MTVLESQALNCVRGILHRIEQFYDEATAGPTLVEPETVVSEVRQVFPDEFARATVRNVSPQIYHRAQVHDFAPAEDTFAELKRHLAEVRRAVATNGSSLGAVMLNEDGDPVLMIIGPDGATRPYHIDEF